MKGKTRRLKGIQKEAKEEMKESNGRKTRWAARRVAGRDKGRGK